MILQDPFNRWFDDVASDPIFISSDAHEEASRNMWSFSLSSEQAENVSTEDVLAFLNEVVNSRRKQLEEGPARSKMLLYIWFDEMAGRLCFSMISNKEDRRLPFRGSVNTAVAMGDVVKKFLKSRYLDMIPLDELAATAGNGGEEQNQLSHNTPLGVHVVSLP